MITVNDRDKIEWNEGMKVSDLLKKMNYVFKLITVTVNGEYVPEEEFEYYTVPDNADVKVLHIFHGG